MLSVAAPTAYHIQRRISSREGALSGEQELNHAQLRDTVGAADFKRKQAAGTDQFPDRVAVQTKHLRSLLKADGIGVAGKHLGIGIVKLHAAYQLLDDDWKKIAIDIEIIQTEGFAATKQVDPNMVLKKDAEVQDGWVGHVLPFELVQSVKMHEEVAALRAKETRLSEIAGEYESHLDELSEEDKEQNFVNDAKDAFVAAEVKKAIKAREVEPATMSILKDVDALFAEEKTLKKQVKDDSAALRQRTKSVIEHLTDEEVRDLLHRKWILPLMENLNSLPDAVLDDFVKQLDAVCKKYETTFEDVESQITDTEHELLGLLDDLQGNEFDMKGIAELKKLLGGE